MKTTVQAAILATLAAGMAGCASVRVSQTPPGPSVRVCSYNVHEGAGERSNTLSVVCGSQADIVVMEESSGPWMRFIQPAVTGAYAHAQSCYADSNGFPNGFSILSKWPCREVAFVDDTNGFYGAWLVEIECPIGPVFVLAVHLDAPADRQGRPAILPYFLTQGRRRDRIKRDFGPVPPGAPLLVLGDFNEGGHGGAVRRLKKEHLTDALPLFGCRTATWTGSFWGIPLWFQLDHILFSPDFVCYDCGVCKGGGSDHRAVWALFGSALDDPTSRREVMPKTARPDRSGDALPMLTPR